MDSLQPIKNYAAYRRTLWILFFAVFSGALMFWLIVFVFLPFHARSGPSFLDKIYWFFILAEGAAFFILQSKLLATVRAEKTLTAKLRRYQTFFLIRLAILEGLIIFGIVIGMTQGSVAAQRISMMFILLMLLFFMPTTSRIATELQLNPQEMRFLDHPDLPLEGK